LKDEVILAGASRVELDEPVGPFDQNRLEGRMKAHQFAICLTEGAIFAARSTNLRADWINA
jgi:hypothetical protein